MDILSLLLCAALCIYIWNNLGSPAQDRLREFTNDVKERVSNKD